MTTSQRREVITDHALLRFMERVKGIDVGAIREEMKAPGLEHALNMGLRKVTIKGVEFFCRKGRVITIWNAAAHGGMTKSLNDKQRSRRKNQRVKRLNSKRNRN